MRKKLLYPCAESLRTQSGKKFDFVIDTEPDIIETSSGFCPNYEKFEQLGITVDKALILCNMD